MVLSISRSQMIPLLGRSGFSCATALLHRACRRGHQYLTNESRYYFGAVGDQYAALILEPFRGYGVMTVQGFGSGTLSFGMTRYSKTCSVTFGDDLVTDCQMKSTCAFWQLVVRPVRMTEWSGCLSGHVAYGILVAPFHLV